MSVKHLSYKKFLNTYLKNKKNMRAYLNECFHDDDEGDFERLIYRGICDAIKARGVANVAKNAKVSRSSLYKSFSGKRKPSLSTFLKVIKALRLAIRLVPAE